MTGSATGGFGIGRSNPRAMLGVRAATNLIFVTRSFDGLGSMVTTRGFAHAATR